MISRIAIHALNFKVVGLYLRETTYSTSSQVYNMLAENYIISYFRSAANRINVAIWGHVQLEIYR